SVAGSAITLDSGSGTHDAPAIAASSDGHLVVTWVQGSPDQVSGVLAGPGLTARSSVFPVSPNPAFLVAQPLNTLPSTTGTAMAGAFRASLPAAVAVAPTGQALSVFNQADMLSDRAIPRVYYRSFGALPNGLGCGTATACSDGFCTSGQCCNAP